MAEHLARIMDALGMAWPVSEETALKSDDSQTTLCGARAILEQMMREIARHDIPSPDTWSAACRCVGWPAPPPLRAGKAITFQEAAAMPAPRRFEP